MDHWRLWHRGNHVGSSLVSEFSGNSAEKSDAGPGQKRKHVTLIESPAVVRERKVQAKAEPTTDQELKKLKSRLLPLTKHPVYGSKVDLSDVTLTKWLAHCDNCAILADVKIRLCLEYRKKHNIDSFLTAYTPPIIAKFYPGGVCGVDKEGSPVYYEFFGILNMKDIMESATREQLIKFKIYQHEKIIKDMKLLSKSSGQKVDTILVVVDMHQCKLDTLWPPALRAWAEIIEVLQDLYPGLVKEVLVINAHFIYPEVYLALRPYLSRSTLKLIKVTGQDFLKHLLQRIEKHELPAFLGGYKCDFNNNPFCMAHLNWTSEIPLCLRFMNKRMLAHVYERNILGGEARTEEYYVPTVGSILTWDFYEVSHPIVLSINLSHTGKETAVLGKTLICDKTLQNNSGSLTCHTSGRYLFVLDNCKDFAHPVKVVFKVEVRFPQETLARLIPKAPIGSTIRFDLPVGEREEQLRQEFFKMRRFMHTSGDRADDQTPQLVTDQVPKEKKRKKKKKKKEACVSITRK